MSTDLHNLVIETADTLTDGRASETLDLDSYLLALMHLVLAGDIPCDLVTLTALRSLAEADGYE
jgi:hypothetical protein